MADWFTEISLVQMVEDFRYVGSELMNEEDPFRSEWHDEQVTEFDMQGDYWEVDGFEYV